LLATGVQVFIADKLREVQNSAELSQLDHKLDHIFGALTTLADPTKYPDMSKQNFRVYDYIGTDLWLTENFGTILGALFFIGSMLILFSKWRAS
jgi:hypothetical protein